MSGDGKRSDAEWPELPRPSSTLPTAPPKPLREWIENLRHRSGHRGDTGRGILYALTPIAAKLLG
jgi:hypothetical protein